MSEPLSLADVNRMMGDNFRETSRHIVLACHAFKTAGVDPALVDKVLAPICGCHNTTRALLGRMLAILDVPAPCCYPGPLEAHLPCGRKYPENVTRA